MRKPQKSIGSYVRRRPLRTAAVFCAVVTLAFILFAKPHSFLLSVFPGYIFDKPAPGVPYADIPLERLSVPENAAPEQPAPESVTSQDNNDIIITYDNIFSLKSFDIIKNNLYNIDRTAYVFDSDLDFGKLLSIDTRVDLHGDEPKVLIFHTHSQEDFIDSRPGAEEDTIVGVGAELARILREKYGVSVLHHKGVYDMENGEVVRGGSYEKMEEGVREVLEKNPSIEVMVDLHRDSLPNNRRLITNINGRQTAQIMFFNGICRLNEHGNPTPTEGLENEYLAENLALSLKMKLLANSMFPGFSRKNYIRPYRYSLHMRPNSLLIEAGSDMNTVTEVKNAMEPLAEILMKALS